MQTTALFSNHLNPCLKLFNSPRFHRFSSKNLIISPLRTRSSISCSNSASSDAISANFGGWDDLLLVDQPSTGTIDVLRSLLFNLKITDSKQGFVFILGFLSAFTVSKVRFSTLAVFPVSLVVFVLGFSAGVARSRSSEGSSWDFDERVIDLKGFLKELDLKMLDLRCGLEEGVSLNRLERTRIRNFVEIVESVRVRTGHLQMVLDGKKSSGKRKDLGVVAFDLVRCIGDLFLECLFTNLRPDTGKDAGSNVDLSMQVNSLVKDDEALEFGALKNVNETVVKNSSVRDVGDSYVERAQGSFGNTDENSSEIVKTVKTVPDASLDSTVKRKKSLHDYGGGYMSDMLSFDEELNGLDSNYGFMATQGSRQEVVLRHRHARPVQNERYSSQTGTTRSFFSTESEESSLLEETLEISGTTYLYSRERIHNSSENKKKSDVDFGGQSNNGINMKSRHQLASSTEDIEQAAMSSLSTLPEDEEFGRNIKEASELLKKARAYMMRPADEEVADSILYKSARLLSTAIAQKPRSLLAIGQLGNTYLLHGELKLKISRELRALLSKSDEFFSAKGRNLHLENLGAKNLNKENAASALIGVCEECEELLVEAGRKYRMVLSIDKNDVRGLYNWGLALTLRAQLIADIGPEAAFDADKVYMAAIDKFDAIVSKSNTCAPDALFRWGIALQQRSNLQRFHSRDKVKLLQQARSLFEDVLRVESDNQLVHEALSSCISELKYIGRRY